jgi:hypothetical protein
MSFIEHSKAWVVCDGPACDNEFIWSQAPAYGWTSTGTGGHLCRAVRPGANNHSCPGVAWVGLYPSELQRCTCPCHLPEDT